MSASQPKPTEIKVPKIVEPGREPSRMITGSSTPGYQFRHTANRQGMNPRESEKGHFEKNVMHSQYPNYDLSQEHLSTLSVREKLRKGIAMGFANSLAYTNTTQSTLQQDSRAQPRQQPTDSMTITGVMNRVDVSHHMIPELSYLHASGVEDGREVEMVNHELVDDTRGATGRAEYYNKRSQHIKDRAVRIRVASERLHVITGTANYHRYFPYPIHDPPSDNLMRVESFPDKEDWSLVPPPISSGLMAWLEWACRRFGYWKLDLDSLHFKHDMAMNKVLKPVMNLGTHSPVSEEIADILDALKLDSEKGSITLYEADILHGNPPQQQRWTWFKVVKPLLDVKGHVPEKYHTTDATMEPPLTTSWTRSHGTREPDAYAQLGDFARLDLDAVTQEATRQLKLEWRFSQNGIPSFAVTPHPWFMSKLPPDFLWVENAPSYSADKSWWDHLGEAAINDREHWHYVQALMSGNICLVEAKSKKGGKWAQVPPLPLRTGNTARKPKTNPGVGVRRAKTTRAASALRNEVQQD
ncbi:hypothetical protein FBEOM_6514 [Fusarium beomiforme]|uniref:Uncharacterized protein n=1 Tax=Fusarium beomiforme TaxID=44412 RepID=A0A9P5AJ50_9HYPO|nr:hypothetical protein FBEOM_6514 [Fusarium beomiforme]